MAAMALVLSSGAVAQRLHPSVLRRPPIKRRQGDGALRTVVAVVAAAAVAAVVVTHAAAHGFMTDPIQRGSLSDVASARGAKRFPGAPVDTYRHFPAGSKSRRPLAAKYSQMAAAPGRVWTKFDPTRRGFVWRAGVCGDPISKTQHKKGGDGGDHTRGGRYYGGGRIVRTYARGGTLTLSMYIVKNHGGFMVLHVCDVARCGGEISTACFTDGHCRRLERVTSGEGLQGGCRSDRPNDCAPVDPAHPYRYVIPCPAARERKQFIGGMDGGAVFRLPSDLTCEHCVVHWYWVTANACNPPGLAAYFEGRHAPVWKNTCRPPREGGYKRQIGTCGDGTNRNDWPEEYYQCADIRINDVGGGSSREDGSSPAPTPTASSPAPTPTASPLPTYTSGGLWLVADGQKVQQLSAHDEVVTVAAGNYSRLTIRAIPPDDAPKGPVVFYIDSKKVWVEQSAPYYLYGNIEERVNYWPPDDVIWGRVFSLKVEFGGRTGRRLDARVRLVG